MDQNASRAKVVGILSPGDMGHAVGRALRQNGMDAVTCLSGRSQRTQKLSRLAGIRSIDSFQQLTVESDLILSIVAPASAESVAEEFVQAVRSSGSKVHFVDCNAISPVTVNRIGELIRATDCLFSDGAIIGFPPGTADPPRLYVSGRDAEAIRFLDGKGVVVKVIGQEIGQASGLKMCYAALTKGKFALYFALLVMAERMSLFAELIAELKASQPDAFDLMQRMLPRLPAKAGRWVGEMEQIASTFEQSGMTPKFHEAAATIYRTISNSRLGQETPESMDLARTLEATIAAIAEQPGGAWAGDLEDYFE